MENKPFHIALIYDGVPNPDSGGGALTIYSFAKALKTLDYKLSAVLLLDKEKISGKTSRQIETFKRIVDKIYFIPKKTKKIGLWQKLRSKLFFSPQEIFPEINIADNVSKKILEIVPDVVFAYHFESVAASFKINNVPKMAIVGDPPFSVMRERFAFFLKSFKLKYFFLLPFYPSLYLRYKKAIICMMNKFDLKGAFAAQHAEELKKSGVIGCKYYCSPVIDVGFGKQSTPKGEKFKILLFGHLKGISSLTGISLFVNKILPALKDKIKEKNLEINVVGAYPDELPNNIKKKLDLPSIKIKGFLDSIEKELLLSDIVLVPTPIKLGVRLRIITAMSFGSLIVSHSANKFGIPELENGVNCLLGSTGAEIAEKIIGCYESRYDLAKIRDNSRKTFLENFESIKAARIILEDLKKICPKK